MHLKFISKKSINIEPIIVHFLCTEWQSSLSQRYSRYNRKASCGYHDAQVYTVSGCTYGSLRIRIHAPEIVIFFSGSGCQTNCQRWFDDVGGYRPRYFEIMEYPKVSTIFLSVTAFISKSFEYKVCMRIRDVSCDMFLVLA